MKKPELSIVIATYNSGSTLSIALTSIEKTFSLYKDNIEVIIQDGCSTDNTLDVANSFSNILKLNIESTKDNGVYDAWNKAILRVNGNWVAFLGSDDWYLDIDCNKLFSVLENATADFIQAPMILNNNGMLSVVIKDESSILESLKSSMSASHPSLLHRASLFERIGLFNPEFRIAGDYDFFCRAIKYGCSISTIDISPLVNFNTGGLSSSPKYAAKTIMELFRIRAANKFPLFRKSDIKPLTAGIIYKLLGHKAYSRILRFIRGE